MIEPVKIIKVEIKNGAGMPSQNYAQILYKEKEVGFINDEGIYLKMYSPEINTGVFQRILQLENKQFSQKCQFLSKNWEAIYDRYDTVFRGK